MHTSASSSSAPAVPAHTAWAIAEIGVYEKAGGEDNPRVVQYHSATRGGPAPDSVAWCSSFQNWCLLQAGIIGTRTKRARDWIEQPPPGFIVFPAHGDITGVRLGDLVVLRRGDDPNQGHVTQYFGRGQQRGFYGLGGNQANEVNVERYLIARALGYVRYVGV